MVEISNKEILTDRDIETLKELSLCLYSVWSEEMETKKRDTVYDNTTLDSFMSSFALMVDDLISKKNIHDYVSYVRGPHLTIEAPLARD